MENTTTAGIELSASERNGFEGTNLVLGAELLGGVGARARGLYPIGCVGTLNDGFATARTCTVNGEWRCAPLDAPAARARARLTVRAEVAAGGAR